ncbi:hypothetical protein JW859_13135 [bacterium]|nr:hypothetical protein [bacterium]
MRIMQLSMLAVILGCAALTGSAAADDARFVLADFDAVLTAAMNDEEITFDTSGVACADRETERLEVRAADVLTGEDVILLIDFAADELLLLYTDTLNGERVKLSSFDTYNGFAGIRRALLGENVDLPAINGKSWKFDVKSADAQYVHEASHADGFKLEWHTAKDTNAPSYVRFNKGEVEAEITITDYRPATAAEVAVKGLGSAVDLANYTIGENEEGVPERLPRI